MKKYRSELTKSLTPEGWQEQINLKDMSLDDMLDLLKDLKVMEAFGKKVGGYMKEAVKGRMPEGAVDYSGPRFIVAIEHVERKAGLDEGRLVDDMGEEWVEGYRKDPIEYDQLKLSEVE